MKTKYNVDTDVYRSGNKYERNEEIKFSLII